MVTLKELAEAAGISSSYTDKTGTERYTSDDVRGFFLRAMGIAGETEQQREASLAALKKEPLLPDVMPFYASESVVLTPKCNSTCEIEISDEKGNTVWSHAVAGGQTAEVAGLPCGYYDVCARTRGGEEERACSLLIIAPDMCWQPEFLKQGQHLGGISAMLYALRSEDSLGIGDFGCLKELVRITARNGGDAVGISPLGIMSPQMLPSPVTAALKGDVSPYRTISRLFINYVYLNLQEEPDFKASAAVKAFIAEPSVAAEIKRLNAAPEVEYSAVLGLKRRLLEMMFDTFRAEGSAERKEAFAAYKRAKGEELENLCLFETLLERHPEETFWRYWQDGTGDISSPQTASVRNNSRPRMDFYAYCHWLADLQLKSTQELALSLGMKIGLYTDMPIGAASNGAEVWENPSAYVLDAGIGAPADPMRPRGQSWGFTPYHPFALQKQHYRPFIRLVQENMQYSGALRIDHAMGLRRLFWGFFAPGNPVVQGAYVYYDIKAMTAILSLESNRRRCLVIGEDLGTVPEGFREYMAKHGLLSYKVFFRQKEKDGTFITPEKYLYMSLAQSSTHDQATAAGFWTNEDIEVFRRCGLYVNDGQYRQNLDGRRKDRLNMIKAFAAKGLLAPGLQKEMEATAERGEKVPEGIEKPVIAYGAETNSALYLLRLCDICAQQKLDNAPGTIDEYPNWRLKLEKTVSEIGKMPEFVAAMAETRKRRAAADEASCPPEAQRAAG